jgi:hypothetical protein
MDGNIVDVTIAEAREKPDKKHVLARLRDWQARVHALYDDVQREVGDGYFYDRSGKVTPDEEPVQRVDVKPHEVPSLDVLTVQQDGRSVAVFRPHHLWMIGANGRVDVMVGPRSGGRRLYMLIDHSLPLRGKADWRIVRPSDRLHQPPFRPEQFGELLE